jgi:hypothetical protein
LHVSFSALTPSSLAFFSSFFKNSKLNRFLIPFILPNILENGVLFSLLFEWCLVFELFAFCSSSSSICMASNPIPSLSFVGTRKFLVEDEAGLVENV